MTSAQNPIEKPNILVVEDEAVIATDLKYCLRRMGYAVPAIACSGEEAIKAASRLRPDLILMDIGLEGQMDGVEAAEQIGSRFDVPVLYLTGNADDSTIERAKKSGPLGYLLKPFKEKDLQVAIEIAIGQYKKEKDLRKSNEALRTLSLTDDLTGLYNRRGFFTLAEHQLKLAHRTKNNFLLAFMDMDRLKAINDRFGHQEGSFALIKVAEILRKTFRESDIIARLGGDEFAVFAMDASDSGGHAITSRLQKELRYYNARNKRGYGLSFSVGIKCFDYNSELSIEEMLAEADIAMYEHKRANGKHGR